VLRKIFVSKEQNKKGEENCRNWRSILEIHIGDPYYIINVMKSKKYKID
jgi:hypothetical protein